jgi:hypothetical protein
MSHFPVEKLEFNGRLPDPNFKLKGIPARDPVFTVSITSVFRLLLL